MFVQTLFDLYQIFQILSSFHEILNDELCNRWCLYPTLYLTVARREKDHTHVLSDVTSYLSNKQDLSPCQTDSITMTSPCFTNALPCNALPLVRTSFLCGQRLNRSHPIPSKGRAASLGSSWPQRRAAVMIMVEEGSSTTKDTGAAGTVPPVDALESPTLYTECSKCKAAYKLEEADLGERGRKVRCAVCENTWFQRSERLLTLRKGLSMKEYPMEEKDELMKKSAEVHSNRRREYSGARREYGGTGRDGDRTRRVYSEGRGAVGRDRPRYRSRRAGSGDFAIFIGNLSYDATEEDLEAFIAGESKPERISIIKDESGRCKGFGFADLSTEMDMHNVIDNLNGRTLLGRPVSIREGNKNRR
eukprot:Plantae.Rhodophyta-Hildenbrandia_rubra.ctg2045.p1 GENE.Plantae.Rhodophyta-Hildenbrandia_rubra.ctg2045~~Plantae.Rhodophyta-Hildenbrandia_rubra.ctg2045.p1  ORF type:complete len:361 (+),score=36.40 Plantae.Rhodophyta-Hildenbrandia_rubra.ctg2045:2241-3323(+)